MTLVELAALPVSLDLPTYRSSSQTWKKSSAQRIGPDVGDGERMERLTLPKYLSSSSTYR